MNKVEEFVLAGGDTIGVLNDRKDRGDIKTLLDSGRVETIRKQIFIACFMKMLIDTKPTLTYRESWSPQPHTSYSNKCSPDIPN